MEKILEIMMLELKKHTQNTGAFKMIHLNKFFVMFFITLMSTVHANAQAETIQFEPGIYENLLLAVNKNGVITGYYREEQGEGVTKTCEFFLQGEAKEGVANIITWGNKPFAGVIKAGTTEINLKIEKGREHPGCGLVLMPEIARGLSFDLITKAPWSELRTIASEKSYFYSEPNSAKRLKSYLVKGDVVGVVAIQDNWLQIEYYSSNAKITRRWICSQNTATLEPID